MSTRGAITLGELRGKLTMLRTRWRLLLRALGHTR
jgi:hypothetical protein